MAIKLKNILLEGKLGDCYQAGGRLIMDMFGDKEHKLVHGMVNGQGMLEGKRYGHCWVESRNTILDHSNGRKLEIPKDIYYAIGRVNPKECFYYTPEEAAKFMVDEGHWGPWEMSGDTVMAEEIPDKRSEIGKHDLRIAPSELEDIESKLMMGEVDYHSKLSRGHKPDWYQLHTPEFKPFDKSRDEDVNEQKNKTHKVIVKNYDYVPKDITINQGDSIKFVNVEGAHNVNGDITHPRNKNNPSSFKNEIGEGWTYTVTFPIPGLHKYHCDPHLSMEMVGTINVIEKQVDENFADGKKPGRKGISKRVGIPKGATLTQLAKLAKSKGEKGRMARWQLNMRRGRKKKKK